MGQRGLDLGPSAAGVCSLRAHVRQWQRSGQMAACEALKIRRYRCAPPTVTCGEVWTSLDYTTLQTRKSTRQLKRSNSGKAGKGLSRLSSPLRTRTRLVGLTNMQCRGYMLLHRPLMPRSTAAVPVRCAGAWANVRRRCVFWKATGAETSCIPIRLRRLQSTSARN